MNTIKPFLLILLLPLLFWNCEGEPGPPGPEGPRGPQGNDGPPGPQGVGLMYEVIFDLNDANDYQAYFSFPEEDLELIYIEDVVLVYLLTGQDEVNGEPVDVWRLMPVAFFDDEGIRTFNFDFTAVDVRIFAEAQYALDPEEDFWEEEVARIVVVPAGYSPNARTKPLNFEDYHSVIEALGIEDFPVGAKPDKK